MRQGPITDRVEVRLPIRAQESINKGQGPIREKLGQGHEPRTNERADSKIIIEITAKTK